MVKLTEFSSLGSRNDKGDSNKWYVPILPPRSSSIFILPPQQYEIWSSENTSGNQNLFKIPRSFVFLVFSISFLHTSSLTYLSGLQATLNTIPSFLPLFSACLLCFIMHRRVVVEGKGGRGSEGLYYGFHFPFSPCRLLALASNWVGASRWIRFLSFLLYVTYHTIYARFLVPVLDFFITFPYSHSHSHSHSFIHPYPLPSFVI